MHEVNVKEKSTKKLVILVDFDGTIECLKMNKSAIQYNKKLIDTLIEAKKKDAIVIGFTNWFSANYDEFYYKSSPGRRRIVDDLKKIYKFEFDAVLTTFSHLRAAQLLIKENFTEYDIQNCTFKLLNSLFDEIRDIEKDYDLDKKSNSETRKNHQEKFKEMKKIEAELNDFKTNYSDDLDRLGLIKRYSKDKEKEEMFRLVKYVLGDKHTFILFDDKDKVHACSKALREEGMRLFNFIVMLKRTNTKLPKSLGPTDYKLAINYPQCYHSYLNLGYIQKKINKMHEDKMKKTNKMREEKNPENYDKLLNLELSRLTQSGRVKKNLADFIKAAKRIFKDNSSEKDGVSENMLAIFHNKIEEKLSRLCDALAMVMFSNFSNDFDVNYLKTILLIENYLLEISKFFHNNKLILKLDSNIKTHVFLKQVNPFRVSLAFKNAENNLLAIFLKYLCYSIEKNMNSIPTMIKIEEKQSLQELIVSKSDLIKVIISLLKNKQLQKKFSYNDVEKYFVEFSPFDQLIKENSQCVDKLFFSNIFTSKECTLDADKIQVRKNTSYKLMGTPFWAPEQKSYFKFKQVQVGILFKLLFVSYYCLLSKSQEEEKINEGININRALDQAKDELCDFFFDKSTDNIIKQYSDLTMIDLSKLIEEQSAQIKVCLGEESFTPTFQ